MQLHIDIVDAFTEQRFKGNSAAVVITDTWLDESLMQSIAMENNLSETAFIVQSDDGSYAIRWFSPITEIDFCGHATLASAFVLFKREPAQESITFTAPAVGSMLITKERDGYIQMDFPNRKPTVVEDVPPALLKGLSIAPERVLKNQQAYIAVYANESDVLDVKQNTVNIKQLAPLDVVVTAEGTEYDFVSRYFWPASGSEEDPVTGSIHTALAPYWAEQLGKTELLAYQASQRGGVLRCKVDGDRVILSGKAVHYLEGVISV